MRRSFYKKIGLAILIGVIVYASLWLIQFKQDTTALGFEFNERFVDAESQKAAFQTMITELRPATIFIPVHWRDIEPRRGEYDFSEIDALILLAQKNGITVVPEFGLTSKECDGCEVPLWVATNDIAANQIAQRNFLIVAVAHLKGFSSVRGWFVSEGQFYDGAIENIRARDGRPIYAQDGAADASVVTIGSTWLPPALWRLIYRDEIKNAIIRVESTGDSNSLLSNVSYAQSLGPSSIIVVNVASNQKEIITALQTLFRLEQR